MNALTLENFDLRLEKHFTQIKTAQNIAEYLKDKNLSEFDLKSLSNKLTKISDNPTETFRFEKNKDQRQVLILRTENIINTIFGKISDMIQWVVDFLANLFGASSGGGTGGSGGSSSGGKSTSTKAGAKLKDNQSKATTAQPEKEKITIDSLSNFIYFNHKNTAEAIDQLKDATASLTKLKVLFLEIQKTINCEKFIQGNDTVENYLKQTSDALEQIFNSKSESKSETPDALGVFSVFGKTKMVINKNDQSVIDFSFIISQEKGSPIEVNKEGTDPYITELLKTWNNLDEQYHSASKEIRNRLKSLGGLSKRIKGSSEKESIVFKEIIILKNISVKTKVVSVFLKHLKEDYDSLTS